MGRHQVRHRKCGRLDKVRDTALRSRFFQRLRLGSKLEHGVGVVVTISYTLDGAEFFTVNLSKATRETFSWGTNNTEVEVVFL